MIELRAHLTVLAWLRAAVRGAVRPGACGGREVKRHLTDADPEPVEEQAKLEVE